jgi:light-independent protochlorophyllide reductase subunit B
VLFDSWVHPLVMGLEEHLLHMFRDDFEFHDAAPPSHLHHATAPDAGPAATDAATDAGASAAEPDAAPLQWSSDGERELRKIPFFVRAKARRNTERYAQERGVRTITVETLYEAKAHFGR